ncbi:chromate transporter [Senegalia massiliensis]|uniref:Chromate transporter n=1 Tax=Senegalia massiliensis TaxID=1720316 RepID=A0A845QY37_9CLOT|nr:chromate transporter [Senegalia massiliensis]NBI06058.1 chromate transporter [Senegalia massiliensis]
MKDLFKFFITFFKIGIFTIGGGYAMLPLIQREVVDNNRWLTEKEFLDILAVAQSSPGAIAINTSILIGYKLNKIKGAIFCAIGVSTPSFLIILFVVKFVYGFRDNIIVEKVFKGLTPAVVGLIGASLWNLYISAKLKPILIIISILAAVFLIIFGISPVYVLLTAAFVSIAYNKLREERKE